jgi:hypothetical protein
MVAAHSGPKIARARPDRARADTPQGKICSIKARRVCRSSPERGRPLEEVR